MGRAGLRMVGATLLTLAATPAWAQLGTDAPDGTRPSQWRVIWHEDPAHQAIIAWTTQSDGASTVYLDTQPRGGTLADYATSVACDTGRYQFSLHRYHHCQVTGLEPSTAYYFVTETEGDVSMEFHFVTAPADGTPFKLLVGGDSRSDRTQRRIMNEMMRSMLEDDPEIIALAHGGDYIANGLSFGDWSEWMTDHELVVTASGRMLPVIPTRGNHESTGSLYDQVWAAPGGENDEYYLTVINDFWLITLNSEASLAGDQRDFLEVQLQAAHDEGACFITAQYHRPAYPAVKEPGDALIHWVPLFEQYDADLIFESDGHALKRTVPIRGEQEDPTGVVYVGEGGLGVDQRTVEDRWFLDYAASQHHVQLVTVRRSELEYAAIRPDMTVADSATFASRRCATSLEVKTPAEGAAFTAGDNMSITWISEGVAEVDLDYSLDGGSTWQAIAMASPNMGRFDWLVPETVTTTGRIRVRATGGGIEALSGRFTIEMAAPPPPPPPPNGAGTDAGTKPEDQNQDGDPNQGAQSDPTEPGEEDSVQPADQLGGCGCTSTQTGAGGLVLVSALGALALLRRRRP